MQQRPRSSYIRARQALLVLLDNCEHLAGARFARRPGDTGAGRFLIGRAVGVAGEVLARGRVEDMHLFGVEPELGLAARADGAGGIEGDDQLGAERLAVELTL